MELTSEEKKKKSQEMCQNLRDKQMLSRFLKREEKRWILVIPVQ